MGDFFDKMNHLKTTKNNIRYAIISKGVSVSQKDTFRSYAQKIDSIPTERNVSKLSLNVSSNDEYDAGEDSAYTSIDINVNPNTKTKNITESGAYDPQKDDCDGYSEVTVNVSSHIKNFTIDTSNLGDDPTAQTFDVSDDADKKTIGYDEVTVDLSGKFQDKRVEIDGSDFGREYDYNAKNDGLYGYKTFVVRVMEKSGPFTVKFWVDRNLKYETQVEKYATAQYVGDVPEKPGKMFIGWDPNPIEVTENMDCYAVFDNETEIADDDGNILLSWGQIASTGGSNIEVGMHKDIYGGAISYDGYSIKSWHSVCTKIGEGEPGTTSTWGFSLNFVGRIYVRSAKSSEIGGPYTRLSEEYDGWPNSDLRKSFMPQVQMSMSHKINGSKDSSALARAIKPVQKYTQCYDKNTSSYKKGYNTTLHNVPTTDTLFLPSYQEITGKSDAETMCPVKYSKAGSTFLRTSSLSFNYSKDDSRLNYEFGRFIRSVGTYNITYFTAYAYVDRTYDSDYEAKYGHKYSEDTSDYMTHKTDVFQSIYICFCT